MNDRREPTISGLHPDEARARAGASSKVPNAKRGSDRPISSGAPASPARTVVVKRSNTLAVFSLLVALAACAGAGYLYMEMTKAQQAFATANTRLLALEEKLTLADGEATASLTTLQANLKEANSEIRKLWGVSYDTNRKTIAKNKADITQVKTQAATSVNTVKAELSVLSDLVDGQQSALTKVERSAENALEKANKAAELDRTVVTLEQRLRNTEEDINAINGFRRSVNEQLQQLRATGTSTAP